VELVLGVVDVLVLETTTVATTLLSKLIRIQRSRVLKDVTPMRECIQHLKDKIGAGVTRVFVLGNKDIHNPNNKNTPKIVNKQEYPSVHAPNFKKYFTTNSVYSGVLCYNK
jgi:hypothetical protein